MGRPPNPETVDKRETATREHYIKVRVSACELYIEFLKTSTGIPRNPLTLEEFVQNADKVRAYLEGP